MLAEVGKYKEVQTYEFLDNEECKKFLLKDVGINILHLNICSINKHFDELLILLESLGTKNIDIIILSECWQQEYIDRYNIPHFQLFYNKATYNKNDGLIIYVNSDISCTTEHITINQITFSRTLFHYKKISFGITSVYRSPSTDELQFLDDFKDFLTNNSAQMLEIIIGDININIINKDHIANNYLNLLASLGFVSHINNPTRLGNTSATCLDHIFIKGIENNNINNISSAIYHTTITDHSTTLVKIEIKEDKVNLRDKQSIKTEIDFEKLNSLLETETWDNIYNTDNVDDMVDYFIKALTLHLDNSTKITKIYKKINKIKPWITIGLIKSINNRNKLKKVWHKNKSNTELELSYKRYRNLTDTLLKKAKYNYYSQKVEEAGKDTKKLWEVVRDMENKGKPGKEIKIKNDEGILLQGDKEIADTANNYFINIGMRMANKLKPNKLQINITPQLNNTSLFLRKVTRNEIILKIAELKNNCSPGKDGISTKVLKCIHEYIVSPLIHIINHIFITGIVPKAFKESIVIPIFKDGSRLEIANYRPISLISNIAKIFEKCLKDRIMDYLESFNLLSSNQYGFRNGKNTELAIYDLVSSINESLDRSEKCLAVFLDLAKAFDTVSHNILLNRAEKVGMRGIVLKILKSYLEDRRQYVKINDTLSDPKVINTGVPQGTVLGPILFLIYIDEIARINKNFKVVSYADDTVLLFTAHSWNQVHKLASIGLSTVNCWLNNSLLTLNEKKNQIYSVLHFKLQQM